MNNPTNQSPAGRLELICGPMFAGKTTELIRRIEAARAAQEITLAIKPAKDTRYADQELVTRAGAPAPWPRQPPPTFLPRSVTRA